MNVFVEDRKDKRPEDRPPMSHINNRIGRPIPPHERRMMMNLEFSENDFDLLNAVFGDPDTAMAVAHIIQNAPPEIQILAVQLMQMIEGGDC